MNSTRQIMNGTWGKLWLSGDLVGEAYGCQAKVTFNKEDVTLCGDLPVDSKIKSTSGKGSCTLYKVSSRMADKISDEIAAGHDPRFTLVSDLNDPDNPGDERVAIYNVSFDDLTLADWKAATIGSVECPFTFTKWGFLDKVEAT